MAVEYPGYPGTTGAPSEEALTTTAELARAIAGAKLLAREGRHHNDPWDDEGVRRAVIRFVAEP